ncbi:MAG: hypothetical protein HLX50_19185 [Alteromonadaceae bacterium]|nr:hypothetical protein [Alteromonadaceae bacterium]
MLLLILGLSGVVLMVVVMCLSTFRGVTALQESTEEFSLKDKLHFCLLYGFIASGLAYTLLRMSGLDVGWAHFFLIMPVPTLIYYSVMRAFIPFGSGTVNSSNEDGNSSSSKDTESGSRHSS